MKSVFAYLRLTVGRYGWIAAVFAVARDLGAVIIGRYYAGRGGWGRGARIAYPARIHNVASIRVGRNFSCGSGLWLDAVRSYREDSFAPLIRIGDRVTASGDLHIACCFKVNIGNDVLLGRRVLITDHSHGRYDGSLPGELDESPVGRRLSGRDVNIGDKCWLGEGVCVLPGVSIGENSVVGANAVVTSDIPANSIAVGVPARVVKTFDRSSGRWIRA